MGRLTRFLLVGAGLVLGAVWALPLPEVSGRCPAAGEGFGWCSLQKAWAPAFLLLVVPPFVLLVVARFLFEWVPDVVARWRAGLRPVRFTRRQQAPPYASDPFLLGAVWGERTGPSSGAPPPEPTDFVGRGRARRGAS